jgi:hypothetical protein
MALKTALSIALLPLLLFGSSCSGGGGDANDFVFYKAPISMVDGRAHSRTLMVTGAGAILGVKQNASGGFVVLQAEVGAEEIQALMADLWDSRKVREKAAGGDPDSGIYQVSARIDRDEFSYGRTVDEPVSKEVVAVRDRLNGILAMAVPAPDPVGTVEPYLSSKIARIRGFAVNALLSAWRSPEVSEDDRKRAETLLLSHQLAETNHEIRKTLHRALSKQPPR